MVAISIRTADLDDLDDLRDVFRSASLSNEGDRAYLLAHPEVLELSDRAVIERRVRVAAIDGRTVGFATTERNGTCVELEDLFVHPDWTRRGVATRLIADVVELSRAAGASTVAVTANSHAMDFYLSVGFRGSETVDTESDPGIRMYLHL